MRSIPSTSTGNPRGNTWSAHTYNVAFSDEIGHFENCLKLDPDFNCAFPPTANGGAPGRGRRLQLLRPGKDSLLIKINGCFFDDEDFDGQSYRNDWPGTNPNAKQDAKFHPTPVLFTSPLIKGKTNYSNVLFEADLPRIEASDSQFNPPFCDRTTGANCVNPPAGAAFYPFFTTRMDHGTCTWQEGGNYIPGTINHFGGNSTSAYGPLLLDAVPVDREPDHLSLQQLPERSGRQPVPPSTADRTADLTGRATMMGRPATRAAPSSCPRATLSLRMTRILVTGGAGYVGSVSVEAFLAAGHEVVVLDDLTTGHRAAVPPGATLHVATYADADAPGPPARDRADRGDPPLRRALAGRRVDRGPGEVLPRQRRRRRRAPRGGADGRRRAARLLVERRGLRRPGRARRSPRTRRSARSTRTARSKRTFESALDWYGRAYGLRSVSLRYFNVAGATDDPRRGPRPRDPPHPERAGGRRGRGDADDLRRRLPDARRHLHPRLHRCRRPRRRAPARASRRRRRATRGPTSALALNLGNGGGFSIREVLAAAEAVVGRPIPYAVGPRREGDPPVLVASAERAAEVLGWRPPARASRTMVGSAWAWRQAHPDGYRTDRSGARGRRARRSTRLARFERGAPPGPAAPAAERARCQLGARVSPRSRPSRRGPARPATAR